MKKAAKKPATKTKKAAAEKPDRSMNETPASGRKIALVKLMKKVGAFSQTTSRTVEFLAEKLGYTKFDVYGLLSGTSGKAGSSPNCLLAHGIARVGDFPDGGRGKSYFLTAKGQKADFSVPPFTRLSVT
jgi:hypothetical protein